MKQIFGALAALALVGAALPAAAQDWRGQHDGRGRVEGSRHYDGGGHRQGYNRAGGYGRRAEIRRRIAIREWRMEQWRRHHRHSYDHRGYGRY